MRCKITRVDELTVFICGRGGQTVSGMRCEECGAPATIQCDGPRPFPQEGTCDKWCCRQHATRVGPNRDRCTACNQPKADPPSPALTALRQANLFR